MYRLIQLQPIPLTSKHGGIMSKSIYVHGVGNESGTTNGPLSKRQTTKIHNLLKRYFMHATITFNRMHYECSAFVRRGSKVVYMCTCDYRGGSQSFYFRTAKDEHDFTGGPNHWGEGFDTIPNRINELLGP
jgi:hypothetical protein